MSSKNSRQRYRDLKGRLAIAFNHASQRSNGRLEGRTFESELALELVANAMSMRKEWLQNEIDPRRNINDECGYPETVTVSMCRTLYDRDSIAARVVQCFPRECWALSPEVYEDEDSEVVTTFEQAWDTLGKNLLGEESKFRQEKGNPIWDYFKKLDTLAGIGTFGLMLLGIDDGLPLWMPVKGYEDGLPSQPQDPDQKKATDDIGQQEQQIRAEENGQVQDDTHDPKQVMEGRATLDNPVGTEAQYYDTFPSQMYDGPMPGSPQERAQRKPEKFVDPRKKKPLTGNALSTDTEDEAVDDDEGVDAEKSGDEESVAGDNGETSYVDDGSDMPEDGDSEIVGEEEKEKAPEFKPKRKLMYLRCFDEHLVQVVQYESDPLNPRFGQPVRYLVTLNDHRTQHGGIGLPLSSVYVHWSRVIHFADSHWQENSSEVFAPPRLECVFNHIWDLVKIYGGGAEGFWKGCVPGLSLETHPSLGGDVVVDKSGLRDMMENRNNGTQRDIMLMGMAAKTLPPTVVDPTPHIDAHLTAIAIKTGIPKRILMGSERGELSSGQDSGEWDEEVQGRCDTLLTPRLIVVFIDRMVGFECLPEPEGYSVKWPDRNKATKLEKAQIAKARFEAFAVYAQGLENLFTPHAAMTTVSDLFTDEEATAILEQTEEAQGEESLTQDPALMDEQQLELQKQQGEQQLQQGEIALKQGQQAIKQGDHDMKLDHKMLGKGMNPRPMGPAATNPALNPANPQQPMMGQQPNGPPQVPGQKPQFGKKPLPGKGQPPQLDKDGNPIDPDANDIDQEQVEEGVK